MKNLVLTDYSINEDIFKKSIIVDLGNLNFHACTGGCQCWIDEGKCHFNDDMTYISEWMKDCSLIIFVSRIKYGTFDIPFRRLLERFMENYEPYYTELNGESVHLGLSQLKKKLIVIGYGDTTEEEREFFNQELKVSSLGSTYTSIDTYFCTDEELEGVLKLFGGVDLV